jgi:hypothetical protein
MLSPQPHKTQLKSNCAMNTLFHGCKNYNYRNINLTLRVVQLWKISNTCLRVSNRDFERDGFPNAPSTATVHKNPSTKTLAIIIIPPNVATVNIQRKPHLLRLIVFGRVSSLDMSQSNSIKYGHLAILITLSQW